MILKKSTPEDNMRVWLALSLITIFRVLTPNYHVISYDQPITLDTVIARLEPGEVVTVTLSPLTLANTPRAEEWGDDMISITVDHTRNYTTWFWAMEAGLRVFEGTGAADYAWSGCDVDCPPVYIKTLAGYDLPPKVFLGGVVVEKRSPIGEAFNFFTRHWHGNR